LEGAVGEAVIDKAAYIRIIVADLRVSLLDEFTGCGSRRKVEFLCRYTQ
jgi:hypothetical protein